MLHACGSAQIDRWKNRVYTGRRIGNASLWIVSLEILLSWLVTLTHLVTWAYIRVPLVNHALPRSQSMIWHLIIISSTPDNDANWFVLRLAKTLTNDFVDHQIRLNQAHPSLDVSIQSTTTVDLHPTAHNKRMTGTPFQSQTQSGETHSPIIKQAQCSRTNTSVGWCKIGLMPDCQHPSKDFSLTPDQKLELLSQLTGHLNPAWNPSKVAILFRSARIKFGKLGRLINTFTCQMRSWRGLLPTL